MSPIVRKLRPKFDPSKDIPYSMQISELCETVANLAEEDMLLQRRAEEADANMHSTVLSSFRRESERTARDQRLNRRCRSGRGERR